MLKISSGLKFFLRNRLLVPKSRTASVHNVPCLGCRYKGYQRDSRDAEGRSHEPFLVVPRAVAIRIQVPEK